jgi:N-methylhydantoinase A
VPGPVCYGRGGTEPTVTDANVVLGYIPAGRLATGGVVVNLQTAQRAIADRIAKPLQMDLFDAALGIHRIANAHMLRALREVSTQRGRDPRGFALIAFGGSGPIHAAGLARDLGVRELIIPPMPGLFSALGMLISGVEHHDARSCLLRGESLTDAAVRSRAAEMRLLMLAQFRQESYREEQVTFECSVDMRYCGQASHIRMRWDDGISDGESIPRLCRAFESEHDRLYGHRAMTNPAVEVIAVRLIGRAPFPQSHRLRAADHPELSRKPRPPTFGEKWSMIETPVVTRTALTEPTRGPLLVDEYDSTIVVPPDMTARLDDENNVIMEFYG